MNSSQVGSGSHLDHLGTKTTVGRSAISQGDVPRCVAPDGSIVHSGMKSSWVGGRGGPLHRDNGSLRAQRWVTKSWTYSQLVGVQGKSGAGTDEPAVSDALLALIFLDEATALAAGHRPCDVRQSKEAERFRECWPVIDDGHLKEWAQIDRILHQERLSEVGRKRTYSSQHQDLPDGSMFQARTGSYLVLGKRSFLWSTRGYAAEARFAPHDIVDVLTPKSVLGVLSAGYGPDIDESILGLL